MSMTAVQIFCWLMCRQRSQPGLCTGAWEWFTAPYVCEGCSNQLLATMQVGGPARVVQGEGAPQGSTGLRACMMAVHLSLPGVQVDKQACVVPQPRGRE